MAATLLSLPEELIERIIGFLSIDHARNALSTCREVYSKGKHAFDRKCFRVVPVNVTQAGLLSSQGNLNNDSCRYIETIILKIDTLLIRPLGPNGVPPVLCLELRDGFLLEQHLAGILSAYLQVTKRCDTIIYQDNPSQYQWRNEDKLLLVLSALSKVLNQLNSPIKLGLHDIRPDDMYNLGRYSQLLERVHSVQLRVGLSTIRMGLFISRIQQSLPLFTNLQELSLHVDPCELRGSEVNLRHILQSIPSKNLQSLTLSGFTIDSMRIQEGTRWSQFPLPIAHI